MFKDFFNSITGEGKKETTQTTVVSTPSGNNQLYLTIGITVFVLAMVWLAYKIA